MTDQQMYRIDSKMVTYSFAYVRAGSAEEARALFEADDSTVEQDYETDFDSSEIVEISVVEG